MRSVLRTVVALGVVLLLAAPAAADAKVKDLIKFYQKEAKFCRKSEAGIVVAKDKAEPYKDDAEIAPDYEVVVKAHTTIGWQCADLDDIIKFLEREPKASYKQLQPELDERDKKIRDGRKATKQALAESDPVIQRMIPRVNKRAAAARGQSH